MSNEDLLREAVDAARAGNRDLARDKLEALLDEDEENVQAWLLLARLTPSLEERRFCLTNVLMLDPNNERAQLMLAQVEEKLSEEEDPEIIPGVRRRTAMIISGVVIVLLVVVCGITISIVSSNNAREAQAEREATNAARTQVAFLELQTQAVIDVTATARATITPTSAAPTLPPTDTPTPTPTPEPTIPPPPADVTGTVFGWSGRDTLNVGYLPVVRYPLAEGGAPQEILSERGRVVTSADGTTIYFNEFQQGSNDPVLVRYNTTQPDTPPADLTPLLLSNVFIEDMAELRVSSDGTRLVFSGRQADTNSRELFLLIFPPQNEDGTPQGEISVARLTADDANYSFPVISPDGGRVVAVRDLPEGGVDLVAINVQNRTQVPLTEDGNALLETMPYFSPDGTIIAYAVAEPNAPHDIIAVASDGSGTSFPLVESEHDDIYPVYSPDGRFLIYSTDRTGNYDLFVRDISAGESYRVTQTEGDDFASGWIVP